MSTAGVVLPACIQTTLNYDYYNFVVNRNLPLVAGLSDTLYHNYASHEELMNLPDGTTVYFIDENKQATLIEFNYGGGWVIMTGQPLEHIYDNAYNGNSEDQNLLPRILAYFTGHPTHDSTY